MKSSTKIVFHLRSIEAYEKGFMLKDITSWNEAWEEARKLTKILYGVQIFAQLIIDGRREQAQIVAITLVDGHEKIFEPSLVKA